MTSTGIRIENILNLSVLLGIMLIYSTSNDAYTTSEITSLFICSLLEVCD